MAGRKNPFDQEEFRNRCVKILFAGYDAALMSNFPLARQLHKYNPPGDDEEHGRCN
jgi:hypothetical protein